MTKFEYKQSQPIAIVEMNKLGAEGWELITVVPGSGGWSATTMYFKRPLSGGSE